MKTLLTALLITAAAIMPAHATQATWKNMDHWTVVGDPATPYCGAVSYYPSLGKAIHIVLNPQGWAIGISGVSVVQGQSYSSRMGTKSKAGTLTGYAINDSTVKFSGLSFDDVKELAKTPFLTIADVGKFSMTGSMVAIIETMVCYKAITDIKASVTAPEPAVSWERDI